MVVDGDPQVVRDALAGRLEPEVGGVRSRAPRRPRSRASARPWRRAAATSPASSSNGAGRSSSRSTTSASGHGLARSAAVRTAVAPPAPASARQRRSTYGLSMRPAGRHAATPHELVQDRGGAGHAAEVDRRRPRRELRAAARSRAPALLGRGAPGPARAPRPGARAGGRGAVARPPPAWRTERERREPGRQDLERRVVAGLADRRGGGAQLGAEVGHRPDELDAARPAPLRSAGARRPRGGAGRRSARIAPMPAAALGGRGGPEQVLADEAAAGRDHDVRGRAGTPSRARRTTKPV